MADSLPPPTALSFVVPSSTDTILSVTDAGPGSGAAIFELAADLDLGEYTEIEGGVEVFTGGSWLPANLVVYDPESPGIFVAAWDPLSTTVGLPWRIVSPVTGWTVDGQPLSPASGTISEAGAFARVQSDKLTLDKLRDRPMIKGS